MAGRMASLLPGSFLGSGGLNVDRSCSGGRGGVGGVRLCMV
jgi:hypothetical protein